MKTLPHSSSSSSSSYDELSIQQSLLFSDSLKELKNLKSQLYSAAEHFEYSFANDINRKKLLNMLKAYVVKALVNSVDHLGCVAYKVNDLLSEKVDEFSETELRLSCLEQRIQVCENKFKQQELVQQKLKIKAPKFNKKYILSDGKFMHESGTKTLVIYQQMNESKQIKDVNATLKTRSSSMRYRSSSRKTQSSSSLQRARSLSPSYRKMSYISPSQRTGKVSSSDKRRAISPHPSSDVLIRSGSFSCRPISRSSSIVRRQHPSKPQKSASMRLHGERSDCREFEQSHSKSKSLLKSLLSRHKGRNEDMLFSYLDEY
ncbi:ABI family protein [Dioscorea alata]|uniref:ABI family protein n=1 Tax=Dioscorea alata TaxID=55571 RepID=A0ACB7TUW9_DIOAL|nr:ABI family protein [Dioscorea alata]